MALSASMSFVRNARFAVALSTLSNDVVVVRLLLLYVTRMQKKNSSVFSLKLLLLARSVGAAKLSQLQS